MESTKSEDRWLIIGALCGVILGITMILFSIYFSPNYAAKNLSPDGILAPKTIFMINVVRIGLNIVGIFFLSIPFLFISKPYLCKFFIKKLDIRNTYLSISIWLFSIITLIFGLPNVINSIVDFHIKIEKRDEHALRLKFHSYYRKQHKIMEFIQNNIPNNDPLLINAKPTYSLHFFAYYLAPRPIYKYSDIFAEELDRAKRKYYVLNVILNKKGKIIQWSISEKPAGNIIIQKTEESS